MSALPEEVPEASPAPPLRPPRKLDIVGNRNWFFGLSLIIIIPGILSMVTRHFLLGVDFAGGTELFLKFNNNPTPAQVQRAVDSTGTEATVQSASGGLFIIRTSLLNPVDQQNLEDKLAQKVGPIDQSKTSATEVGGAVAQETIYRAGLAILLASSAILLYLAFRFRKVRGGWRAGIQFGGSALLALLHDVAVLTGIFSILGTYLNQRIGEIDSLFMTAVLTVVGFSVHDTVVVFDRIRENLIVSQRLTFEQVVNLSILQTTARSIITSFTVVLVLLALLLFGGETIKGFILALLIGIVSGTYSSIFNAAPLLVVWRRLQPVR